MRRGSRAEQQFRVQDSRSVDSSATCEDLGRDELIHESNDGSSPPCGPSQSRGGRGKRVGEPHSLPMATCMKMLEAYLTCPSAAHVARVVGVSQRCARKYIERGDPKRGLPPLRDRYAEIQAGIVGRENAALRGQREGPASLLYQSLFDERTGTFRDPRMVTVRNYTRLVDAELRAIGREEGVDYDALIAGRRPTGRKAPARSIQPTPRVDRAPESTAPSDLEAVKRWLDRTEKKTNGWRG